MPRKTKFSPVWLEKNDRNGKVVKTWCRASDDEFSAFCILCDSTFKISNQGFSQILLHADGAKHKKASNNMKNQAVFSVQSSTSQLVLTSTASTNVFIPNSLSDKILRAEIILVLTAIKNNYSFASLTDLSQIYSEIFEDSDIAKGIKLSDKKARYMLNFGLAPYFKSLLFKDITESYYVIHFDETTTKQVKKQLDIYVSYWSNMKGSMVISYCESYFLGHADSDTILENVLKFIENNDLSLGKLLQISMDGPNVNLSLLQKLNNALSKKSLPPLLNIGTCNLHIMHNALRKGLGKLEFDIDKFALDVHQWFRASPARKEDFHSLQVELLDEALANHVFLRHVDTRWLTLGPVCDRLIEQYEVLKQYFLKELVVRNQGNIALERYNRIVNWLKDPCTLMHLHFISYLSTLFKPYMLLLQKETPVIHILYSKLNELVRSLYLKFMKTKVVGDRKGFQLTDINPDDGENWVECKKIVIGHAATNIASDFDLKKSFFLSIRSCYITISKYLVQKLPITDPFLNDVQCLSPVNRKKVSSKGSASRLPQYVPQVCKTVNMSDRISEEWLLYMCDDDLTSITSAYDVDHDICKYWDDISKIKDCTGNLKYPNLSAVAKTCLILSPANAQPERGFSVNNSIVTKERSSLSDLCIKSIRMCKDVIRLHNYNIQSIKITKALLCQVRKSHAEYSSYMEQQKKEKVEQQRKREAEEAALAVANEKRIKLLKFEDMLIQLQNEEKNLISDQNAAQTLLNDASAKLGKAIGENNMSEVKVAQMMISAANGEMQSVNSKLTECCRQQEQLKLKMKSN